MRPNENSIAATVSIIQYIAFAGMRMQPLHLQQPPSERNATFDAIKSENALFYLFFKC